MKNLFLLVFVMLFSFPMIAQEEVTSTGPTTVSIADIMNVDPVSVTMSEQVEKNIAEYAKTWEDEKGRLDGALEDLNGDYTKKVEGVIENFTKVLERAIQQDVDNEKKSVTTQVNALTFEHRKNKKDELTAFNNKIVVELRESDLPKKLNQEKRDQIDELMESYKDVFEEEFETNQLVIEQFKNTEHLVEGDMLPSGGESGN